MGIQRHARDTAARLSAAIAGLDPPLAVLKLDALARNADDLVRRAGGTPIRVASKSVRCRWVLHGVLSRQGFSGLMGYSLAEAIWLVRDGFDDVLIGYPSVSRAGLQELGADLGLLAAITLMIDDPAQLELIDSVVPAPVAPIRICLDVDASLRIGRAHLGVRRSPIRTPEQAAELARVAVRRGFAVVSVMFYEAQLAGLPDSSPAVAWVKRRSVEELSSRRTAVAAAVRAVAGVALEFVNSGGTGSLEVSAADSCVTEVTAGSGLYSPTLFDGYRQFRGEPALLFALPVVRRPARGIVTAFGGGYVASGPAKRSRLPRPFDDRLKLIGTEGAGEVQTPVRGRPARSLKIGEPVWFRHAKAGEMLERFDQVHVVDGTAIVHTVPSYRGEGKNFG